MPEGDTVWRAARQLDQALTGRVLSRSDFRVPRYATTDLTGRRVTGTVPRGKHLLTRLDGGLTVHTHLKMDGSWRVQPAGRPAPRDYKIRLVLSNTEFQAIGRLLGIVEVLPTRHEDRIVGHLGPDLLGPDWDAAEALRRLRDRPERPVAEALLDQRNLAGIGNVYKSEVLFVRGISPWCPVGEIGDLDGVVALAQRLLAANKDRTGRITTGRSAPGHATWVYGRAGQACRRCGTRVRSAQGDPGRSAATRLTNGDIDAEDRITFWCPHCQPAPG
jgi:endonuclease-8